MQNTCAIGGIYEAQWSFCGDLVRGRDACAGRHACGGRTNSRFTDIQSNHRAPSTNGKRSCARFQLRIFARIWSGSPRIRITSDHPTTRTMRSGFWRSSKSLVSTRHIEQFDVLFPTPKERAVELVDGGPKFTAKLQEPALPEDRHRIKQSEQLPTYNAYSIDGDVTAPLVYVNYGIPEDYEQLERMGISVKGKIVIAKYFHSWRGNQAQGCGGARRGWLPDLFRSA